MEASTLLTLIPSLQEAPGGQGSDRGGEASPRDSGNGKHTTCEMGTRETLIQSPGCMLALLAGHIGKAGAEPGC